MIQNSMFLPLVGAVLLSGCAASSIDDPSFQALGTQNGDVTSLASDKPVAGVETQLNAPPTDAVSAAAAKKNSARDTVKAVISVSEPSSNAYKVGPLDILEISVFKVPDLSKTIQVSEAGTINYPLIGEVAAAGKTAREIEHDLTRTLGAKYLQKPQVTVFVKEHNSQRITIEGAVKKPGVYPIRGDMSLLQAIATANGMDPLSDETVLVFRTSGGKRSAARFDIAQIRSGEAEDPPLESGDVLVAGNSAFKEGMQNVLTALRFTSVFALF